MSELPGNYVRCLSGHYHANVRGDGYCPTCDQLRAMEAQIAVYNSNGFADADALAAKYLDLESQLREKDAEIDRITGLFFETEGITANGELLPTKEKVVQALVERDAEIERLRAALALFANPDNWYAVEDPPGSYPPSYAPAWRSFVCPNNPDEWAARAIDAARSTPSDLWSD